MSSTTKTIILAAVILAAVFAGVAFAEEETDATGVTVTYHLGGASIPVTTAEDGTVVLYGPEDVASFFQPEGGDFVAWQTEEDGGTIYQFGATVAFSTATDLYPRIIAATTVDFIVDGQVVEGGAVAPVEGKVTAPAVPSKEGYNALGWEWSEDGKVYTVEQISGLTVAAGQTFTAVYSEIFDVEWVVDGVTIATGSTETGRELAQPADPSKANHTFAGWAVDGEVALKAGEKLTAEDVTADVTYTATFDPVMLTVTFVAGESTVATVSVPFGQMVVMPALPEGFTAWDFDFQTPITESITVKAVASTVEPTTTYNVQFVVDGQVVATFKSDAITVPTDPVKAGYRFQGWAIGDNVVANPAAYTYTADTILVALFQQLEVVEHVVTFVTADGETEVSVIDGQAVTAPAAPEGMQWDPAVDLEAPVTADLTVNAVPLKVTVQFAVDGDIIAILTQTIDYGGTVDMDLLAGYTFPAGYTGWDVDLTMPFYKDTVVNATVPPVVDEPDFLDSPVNVLAVVLVVVILAALAGCYVTNLFGVKDAVSKIVRRKGKGGEQ